MNLKVEEILMVIVAFLIGWFVRTIISGSSSDIISLEGSVKAVGGKHYNATCEEHPWGEDRKQLDFLVEQCHHRDDKTPRGNNALGILKECYGIPNPANITTSESCEVLRKGWVCKAFGGAACNSPEEFDEDPKELIEKFIKTTTR